jgi:hypothetical protein
VDTTQRIIVGTTGGVVMVGGVTWAASWYFAGGNPSAWRLAPAVAMFVLGLGAIVWTLRRNLRKELQGRLDEFLAAGKAVIAHPGFDNELRRREWTAAVLFLLSRAIEPETADTFVPGKIAANPSTQEEALAVVEWQVDALTKIRAGVADHSVPVRKGWLR